MTDRGIATPAARPGTTAADVLGRVPPIDPTIQVERWPRFVAGVAVLCWSLGLVGLIVEVTSGNASHVSWPDFGIALAYPAVAMLVAHVPQARRWSALTLMSALFSGLNVATSAWADRLYDAHRHPTPGAPWAAWLEGWTWIVSIVGFAAIAYFPDGRLPSGRWRAAPGALAAGGLIVAVGNALRPRIDEYEIGNPIPFPHIATSVPLGAIGVGLAAAGLTGCLASVVVNFRRADAVARRQIGWYAYGYAITLVVLAVAVTTNLPSALFAIAPATVAAGGGVAILRYRLYDIDRIVNRTLAWALLTALVVAVYVVSVGFCQRLFTHGGTVGGLVATGLVAVAFQPLRVGVQRAVNQLIYGYRDQPEVVLREIAATLDASAGTDDTLRSLADTVARALRLPAAVLDVDGGPEFRSTYANAERDPASDTELIDAAHADSGGTRVRILVEPRGRTGLAARDRQLLADLAPSLAAAAEAHRLGRALEGSRVRAIEALADEQRRLRRDLHDGLGPVLAGLRMTIGAARRLIDVSPAEAERLLAEAHGDAQAAIDDVRRLAHDLRPPSLDELGLAAALRDRLDRLIDGACALEYVTRDLPVPLPAAIEVAAYRIGCEAVLNVVRHASARRCAVTLFGHDGGLAMSIEDDGVGLSDQIVSTSVGVRAMRERAEELGGTIAFERRSSSVRPERGTAVRVWLPYRTADGSAS